MTSHFLSVSDLMTTAVVSVRATEPLREAHADMQMGAFRHMPVVDDRGRLVGIISDRDVLRAISRHKATLVGEVMTRQPVTVKPDTVAHAAALVMLERKIGGLPVVDEDGHLVGLITQTDFLEVARRALLGLPLARE
ncbi:MAG: CBS domain-containing protein [Kofleriaceae bacterium]|nr:CBS domain-containing protein [Kofleriaceae bacterium]MCB9574714.1 CBS domain-containing protein [Kofleriaceae bacterium]